MCTTLIITKGAMADGSMVVTHSDDDELGDQTLIRVPAQDHAPGATRDILREHYLHPRIVSSERGPGYQPAPGTVPSWALPLGSIAQPAHTYAYFDGNYAIMNEHNLMIGECTNGTKYEPEAVSVAEAQERGIHVRLLYSQELSRIALERCVSARDAVVMMGELIEEYGLYSTGETLLVADEDEAWVCLLYTSDADIPAFFGKTTKNGFPWMSVGLIGVIALVLVRFTSIIDVIVLCNIVALAAMVIVNASAAVLAHRGFPGSGYRIPGGPVIPIVAGIACVVQFFSYSLVQLLSLIHI